MKMRPVDQKAALGQLFSKQYLTSYLNYGNINNRINGGFSGKAGINWIRETDQVMLMAYNVKQQTTYYKLSGARRSDGAESLVIPLHEKGNEFHTWISFISDDRESISMSNYTGNWIF